MRILIAVMAAAALALSGCGGSDSASSSPPTTPTPSSTHQAEPDEPDLISVPGYEFMAVPADAEQAVDGMLTVFQGMFESGSLHGVTTTAGTEVGVLMLLTASAAAQDLGIGSDEFNLEMYEGFTDGSEGEVQSMEGESLVTGAPVDGTKAFVWFHEGVVSIFDGDPDESADFMTAYLQAHA